MVRGRKLVKWAGIGSNAVIRVLCGGKLDPPPQQRCPTLDSSTTLQHSPVSAVFF